jgi:hypothetical protein
MRYFFKLYKYLQRGGDFFWNSLDFLVPYSSLEKKRDDFVHRTAEPRVRKTKAKADRRIPRTKMDRGK